MDNTSRASQGICSVCNELIAVRISGMSFVIDAHVVNSKGCPGQGTTPFSKKLAQKRKIYEEEFATT
ncbi:MAG: hypothetical protein AAB362_03355 [Patescibacteria group bacterium]